MKIRVEIEVPEGEFCELATEPDDPEEPDPFYCGRLSGNEYYMFCTLFDDAYLKSEGRAVRKCQPCLDACRAAEGEK